MSLNAPKPREALHERRIDCTGYQRADGLWDIEAHLTDAKTYSFSNAHRGEIAPGDPFHDMWLRLTLDDGLVVREVEAAIEAGPFRICGDITPAFAELKGLKVGPGWHKRVRQRLGGIHGCTHLVELLGPMGTVAYQTVLSERGRTRKRAPDKKPGHLDSCHALRSDGEVVKEFYPEWYTGQSGRP